MQAATIDDVISTDEYPELPSHISEDASHLKSRQKNFRASSGTLAPLCTLPHSIVRDIALLLDLPSAAALSLSCKTLYNMISSEFAQDLWKILFVKHSRKVSLTMNADAVLPLPVVVPGEASLPEWQRNLLKVPLKGQHRVLRNLKKSLLQVGSQPVLDINSAIAIFDPHDSSGQNYFIPCVLGGSWRVFFTGRGQSPALCDLLLATHSSVSLTGWDLLQRPWENLVIPLYVQEYSFILCDQQRRQHLLQDQGALIAGLEGQLGFWQVAAGTFSAARGVWASANEGTYSLSVLRNSSGLICAILVDIHFANAIRLVRDEFSVVKRFALYVKKTPLQTGVVRRTVPLAASAPSVPISLKRKKPPVEQLPPPGSTFTDEQFAIIADLCFRYGLIEGVERAMHELPSTIQKSQVKDLACSILSDSADTGVLLFDSECQLVMSSNEDASKKRMLK